MRKPRIVDTAEKLETWITVEFDGEEDQEGLATLAAELAPKHPNNLVLKIRNTGREIDVKMVLAQGFRQLQTDRDALLKENAELRKLLQDLKVAEAYKGPSAKS